MEEWIELEVDKDKASWKCFNKHRRKLKRKTMKNKESFIFCLSLNNSDSITLRLKSDLRKKTPTQFNLPSRVFITFNLTVTKPDITFALSIMSQFPNASCDSHWNAVIQNFRYTKNALGKWLLYEDKSDAKIIYYSDAYWVRSPSDRRSTSEYCVLIGENLIAWRSKKQNTIALSGAEAEYSVMAVASKELA
ncbi:secreted RxLR effector protein 161-like [Lathyrus oleraceus]|uniref:secreted RxLR effector protein 161-like n=1 Tax=Pisum sativum TaxID=3888 RepID=UPI0021CE1D62|nr:secreted RxLR effector protein 161-like [Pisum sativum]